MTEYLDSRCSLGKVNSQFNRHCMANSGTWAEPRRKWYTNTTVLTGPVLSVWSLFASGHYKLFIMIVTNFTTPFQTHSSRPSTENIRNANARQSGGLRETPRRQRGRQGKVIDSIFSVRVFMGKPRCWHWICSTDVVNVSKMHVAS